MLEEGENNCGEMISRESILDIKPLLLFSIIQLPRKHKLSKKTPMQYNANAVSFIPK